MVRTSFEDVLSEAAARRAAAGAFTCYGLEVAHAVLSGAEQAGVGVILLVSEATFRSPYGRTLTAALVGAVEKSTARACVQLDHARDLDAIGVALDLGVDAVMADGSHLDLDENLAFTQAAAELASTAGAAIEAELGRITGDEDLLSAATAGGLTDPDEAASFVAETRPACLGVSIGNVHGAYVGEPRLDLDRLSAIRACVNVPLAVHGASGLKPSVMRALIERGAQKFNVNTALRKRYLGALETQLGTARAHSDVLSLVTQVSGALEDVVAETLLQLSQLSPDQSPAPLGGET